jgi:sodium transport system ATP-binding protein
MIEVSGVARSFVAAASAKGGPGGRGGLLGLGAKRAGARVVHAVRDVSFSAPGGHITGLLGPNGAGKTTTLRMLAGLITPEAGRLSVDGIDVVERPREVLARMGVLSDSRGLYPRLTARENIVYYGELQGMEREPPSARPGPGADVRHDGFARPPHRGLQPGRADEDALARALVHDPANIVSTSRPTASTCSPPVPAREPALAAHAGRRRQVHRLPTHIMQEVERLCDSVVVAEGRTVASGTVAELLARTGQSDFEEAFVRFAFPPTATGVPA